MIYSLSTFLYSLFSVLAIVCIVAVSVRAAPKFFKENGVAFKIVISIALGVMLGIASLHLLPEAFESDTHLASVTFLVSLLFFTALLWLTHSHEHGDTHEHHSHEQIKSSSMFLGQSIHAVTDGVAVALAWLASPATGLVVSSAIAVHHIPMMSGVAERYRKHFSGPKLICLTTLSSSAMIIGVLLVTLLSGVIVPGVLMAIAAASFIFVALSDFVIHLNEDSTRQTKTIIIIGAILGSLIAYGAETVIHQTESHDSEAGQVINL